MRASALFLSSIKIFLAIFDAKSISSVIIAAIALSKRLSSDRFTSSISKLKRTKYPSTFYLININEKLDTIIIDSVRLYFNVINASNLIEEAELKRELASKIYQSSLKLFERGMITDKILRENKNNLDLNNLDYEITLNNLQTAKNLV